MEWRNGCLGIHKGFIRSVFAMCSLCVRYVFAHYRTNNEATTNSIVINTA